MEMIQQKPIHTAPPKLQHILLHMQKYDYTVQYKPGKEMVLANLQGVPTYSHPPKHPACPIVHIRAECYPRNHWMWPSLQHSILPHHQGMAWPPQAGPSDCPTLLGYLGQTVHRGWYSPEWNPSMHSSRTQSSHPCWPPQSAPGNRQDANASEGSCILAQYWWQHHQLHLQVHHIHKAQGLSTGSANASMRHPQWPMAGDLQPVTFTTEVKSTCSSAICSASTPSYPMFPPNQPISCPKSYRN